jgi:GAF domain-containing protein
MDRQLVSDWRSEVQRHRAILLNYLLMAGVGIGFIALVAIYVGGLSVAGANPLERSDMWPFVAGWFVVLIAWLWRGLGYRVRAGILLFLTYLIGFYLFAEGGLSGGGRIWLVLLPALAFILLGQWPGFAAGGISILTYVFFALAFSQGVFTLRAIDLVSPAYWTTESGDFLVGVIGMALILWSFNRGWVNALTQASLANQQLQAQTEALEETTRQLRATDAIAHACSSILDPKALVAEVVNQIQKEFGSMGVYYVGLFLLDETGKDGGEQFAALKAATGALGRRLLDQGHTVALDGISAVGRCIIQQRSIVAMGESAEGLPDGSLLEGARSGAVLPLRSRGRVLGALSVQSAQAGVFGESVVDVLEAMADQVAVALDNARLFAQTGSALREVQAAQRRYLGQAWKEFLTIRPVTHVDYVQPGLEVGGDGDGLLQDARLAAMAHERAVATDSAPSADSGGKLASPQTVLAVPLKVRGQVIGTLSLHETRRRRPWTTEEIALAETIAEQVALTVENLRLMDEAQRRAARERLAAEITGRMRETLDMDTVLKVAVRELRQSLGLPEVEVRMRSDV